LGEEYIEPWESPAVIEPQVLEICEELKHLVLLFWELLRPPIRIEV
jgi:hypothetical protein